MDCKKINRLTKSKTAFQESVCKHLKFSLGLEWQKSSNRELFWGVSLAIRDRLIEKMIETEARYQKADAKRIYYLSLEFLLGRSLGNNIYNLGIFKNFEKAMTEMGVDLEEIRDSEVDAALGNGGLGRLAACFLDSMATLDLPGYGYGINYEFGLFKQEIDNGYQKEKPDNWLSKGTPWQIEKPEEACIIPVYGKIDHSLDREGKYNPMWMDWKVLIGVPHDMPIVGYGGRTVNYLRLYSTRSSDEFDMDIFNEGDYFKAVEQKMSSETISKVLYPTDTFEAGRELRLVQEYFLVACSMRDIIRRYQQTHDTFDAFSSKVAIQLNDTHPALAVVELMRILIDENALSWEKAWNITKATFAYTNHTLLPEALEKWSVPIMEHVLPRHTQIIYEINHRFLDQVASKWPGDNDRLRQMSIIEEGGPKQVRMAYLAIAGSHSVNGVAELHTKLLTNSLLPDFYEFWPEKFNNKTNGVTQRRWLLKSNPDLSNLISKSIGDNWIKDIDKLKTLEPYAYDKAFQKEFLKIKRANKEKLANVILDTTRVKVSPESLFSIQAKRIHEYKRQLLNVLHVIHQYLCLIEDGQKPLVPRTYIFAGKAAPGYWAAKQIIKLINSVGAVVNNDPRVKDWIKVVFIPDYRVSLAEKIIPAADLSEQISTAGKEASGTGNMKFALNGALTIGTLDGANVEILEEVGEDNIFIFGLNAEEVHQMRSERSYAPWEYYNKNPHIKRVMDSLNSYMFCAKEPSLFRWIFDALMNSQEEYIHLADLESYIEAQKKAEACFKDIDTWVKKAILNVARIGKFSSDRTISDYAKEIWDVKSY
jgi:starch phosphorylase